MTTHSRHTNRTVVMWTKYPNVVTTNDYREAPPGRALALPAQIGAYDQ
jgi:hypothetical protein